MPAAYVYLMIAKMASERLRNDPDAVEKLFGAILRNPLVWRAIGLGWSPLRNLEKRIIGRRASGG